MPDLSNSSFIPKQGPTKKRRGQATRQVYVFTIISYVMIFSTLLAVGGVYFYSEYIERQRDNEIAALDAAINSYSESDMQKVLEFDHRLNQASSRLSNSASIVSVLESLEDAVIETVQIESLEMTRQGDELFDLSAKIKTDSFDSTMFQRGVLQRGKPTIETVVLSDLHRQTVNNEESATKETTVSFLAKITVPLSVVPNLAGASVAEETPQPITITVDDSETPTLNAVEEIKDPGDETVIYEATASINSDDI